MKSSVISKQAYVQAHGELTQRATSEEAIAMWAKFEKLGGQDYLLLEPEKGEKIDRLRATWWHKLNTLAFRFHRTFKVRACINRAENHVVLWKEPRTVPSTQTGKPPAGQKP